jgi:hypothetical protein
MGTRGTRVPLIFPIQEFDVPEDPFTASASPPFLREYILFLHINLCLHRMAQLNKCRRRHFPITKVLYDAVSK